MADLSATLQELLRTADTSSLIEKLRSQNYFTVDDDKKSIRSDYTWVTDDNVSTASGTCHRRLIWPDGTLYEGSINANQKPDGQGKLKASSGDRYVGEWLDGQLHGFGEYTLADGGVYRGQIADNMKEGFGRLTCRNGLSYEGEWHKDKPHGEGRLTHDDVIFCGHWVHGRIEGRGVYEAASWGRYVGEWKADEKDGVGKVVYASGASYDGHWENDVAHGLGRYTWCNGSVYEGQFCRGQLQGHGRFTASDGKEVFVGSWFQSKKSGTGQMKFPDGAVYSGEWIADRPHGKGAFINPYGVMFRGMWLEGLYVWDENGGSKGGMPICIIEGSSYQLQEDLQDAEQPNTLIDTRVVLPAVAPGHELSTHQLPRPRRFDQILSDYTAESSSTFVSCVHPNPRPQPPAFDSGYAYHTRFEIEYWPYTGEQPTVGTQAAVQTTLLPPRPTFGDYYAPTPVNQPDIYNLPVQDFYTAATPKVHETVYIDAPYHRKSIPNVQEIHPSSRPDTPIDTCRVDHINISRKTTGTLNPASSRQTTGLYASRLGSPPQAESPGSWVGEEPHSISTADTVLVRNVPVPVEVSVTSELRFPKIRTHRTQVAFPVYAPRIREVPIAAESLTAEGLQLCEEIAHQVELLQAASKEEFCLTGCQLDCLTEEITAFLSENATHLAPTKPLSLCDFLL